MRECRFHAYEALIVAQSPNSSRKYRRENGFHSKNHSLAFTVKSITNQMLMLLFFMKITVLLVVEYGLMLGHVQGNAGRNVGGV